MAGRGQSPFNSAWMKKPEQLYNTISFSNLNNDANQSTVWNEWYFGVTTTATSTGNFFMFM